MQQSDDLKSYKNFDLQNRIVYKGIPISLYRSRVTGLLISIAELEVPLVNSFITIATEASDHDGCPHTLEHLIFLGSEDYPYKGILDQLANRCFAQGTNAWTDVDHTCYTLTTAGSEGFLRLLPVYMDHIVYPTLTDSGFHTEVHHIDGEGRDAGVVYCEMQSCENVGSTKTYHSLMETLFANSGYGCNTGGRVENLRSLKVEKVRQYHKDYYRPNNINVIITGKVSPKEVIDSITPVEEKIIKKNFKYSDQKPWSSPIPPFVKAVEETVEFPSNDEDGAIVKIGWRGPTWSDMFTKTSIQILWVYLTESPVSPLQKEFIEVDDPYAGRVDYALIDGSQFSHFVDFSSVPAKQLEKIKEKFFETINNVVKNGIDLKRMKTIIKKRREKHYDEIEQDPHRTIATFLISNFLYATKNEELLKSLDIVPILEELLKKDNHFWCELIQKHLVQNPHVCIIGKPSVELGQKLSKEEDDRLEKRRNELGAEVLEKLEAELDEAEEKNNMPIPQEIFSKFDVPDVNGIPFIPVVTYRSIDSPSNEKSQKLKTHIENDHPSPFPFFVEMDHIPSAFVNLVCFMDSEGLDDQLRNYIELYLETIFETPIQKNGEIMTHEQVIQMLEEELVEHSNDCGIGGGGNFSCGSFAQLIQLQLKVEQSNYQKSIEILKDILWNTKFTADRLKIAAQKLTNDVARAKRGPRTVTRSVMKYKVFDPLKSNHNASNMVKQYNFLSEVMKKLDENPESVIQDMEKLRSLITKPQNMRLHVSGDIYGLKHPKKPWIEGFASKDIIPEVSSINENVSPPDFTFTSKLLNKDVFEFKSKEGLIVGLASTDSAYLSQTCPSISDYNDTERASLLVLIEYFTALEGPFWKSIRGKGLSYGYSMSINIEEGLLYFVLAKSSSLVKAYNEASSIIEGFLKSAEFDKHEIEAAKSGVIFEIISNEETIHSAAETQFIQFLQKVPSNSNRTLLDKVSKVTQEDLNRVLKQHLSKLFDQSTSNSVICTNPSKVQEVISGFSDRKFVEISIDDFLLTGNIPNTEDSTATAKDDKQKN